MGQRTKDIWDSYLCKQYKMGSIPASELNVRFRGLNGESRAKEARCWPMMVGAQFGSFTTAIVPGDVPCLMSLEAMKGMQMGIDTAKSQVQVTLNGIESVLQTKYTPEGHLALNIWSKLTPKKTKFALVVTGENSVPDDHHQNGQMSMAPIKLESQAKMTPEEYKTLKTLQSLARDSTSSNVSPANLDRLTDMVHSLGLADTFVDTDSVRGAVLAYKPLVHRVCPPHVDATHVFAIAVHNGVLHYPSGKQWSALTHKRQVMKTRFDLVIFIFAKLKAKQKHDSVSLTWKPVNVHKTTSKHTGYVVSSQISKHVYPPGLEPEPSAEGNHFHVKEPWQGKVSRAKGPPEFPHTLEENLSRGGNATTIWWDCKTCKNRIVETNKSTMINKYFAVPACAGTPGASKHLKAPIPSDLKQEIPTPPLWRKTQSENTYTEEEKSVLQKARELLEGKKGQSKACASTDDPLGRRKSSKKRVPPKAEDCMILSSSDSEYDVVFQKETTTTTVNVTEPSDEEILQQIEALTLILKDRKSKKPGK